MVTRNSRAFQSNEARRYAERSPRHGASSVRAFSSRYSDALEDNFPNRVPKPTDPKIVPPRGRSTRNQKPRRAPGPTMGREPAMVLAGEECCIVPPGETNLADESVGRVPHRSPTVPLAIVRSRDLAISDLGLLSMCSGIRPRRTGTSQPRRARARLPRRGSMTRHRRHHPMQSQFEELRSSKNHAASDDLADFARSGFVRSPRCSP